MKKILLAAMLILGTAEAQTLTLNASAYNAHVSQTDSTPNVTATGTRARVGIVAMSRDMLRVFPYGSRVRVVSQRGCGVNLVGQTFRVEDTMNRRRTRSIDVFMNSHSRAITFGRCSMTVKRVS